LGGKEVFKPKFAFVLVMILGVLLGGVVVAQDDIFAGKG